MTTATGCTTTVAFRLAEFKNGECKNWGNPLAEAYLTALRWFANQPPSGDFRANDSTLIEGLNQPQSYQPPSISANNECASLNTVVFNASTISYDGDELDDNSDGLRSVNADKSSVELTNLIGANEGIHGKSFFVGENGQTTQGDDDHQLCTAKEVNALGEVRGICPEGPRLEGTFRIAGAAYHAYTGDVNTQNQISGQQSVKTYAVQLASNTPKIDLVAPSGERTVTLLPACLNLDLRGANSDRNGACAIVDFKHAQAPYAHRESHCGRPRHRWQRGACGGRSAASTARRPSCAASSTSTGKTVSRAATMTRICGASSTIA